MDFIERIFNISPDGGDGSTEALYLVVGIALLGLTIIARSVLAKRKPKG